MKKGRLITTALLISAVVVGIGYFYPRSYNDYEKIVSQSHKNISYTHAVSVYMDSYKNDKGNEELMNKLNRSMIIMSGVVDDTKFDKKYELASNKEDFAWERLNIDSGLVLTNPVIYKKVSKGKVSEETTLDTKIFSDLLKSVNEKNTKINHTQVEIYNYNKDNAIEILGEDKKVHDLLAGIIKNYVDSKEFHNFMSENHLIESKMKDDFRNDNEIQKDNDLYFDKFKSINKIMDSIDIKDSKVIMKFKKNQLINVSIEAPCEYRTGDTPMKFKLLLNSDYYNEGKSKVPDENINDSNIIDLSKLSKEDFSEFKK